MMDRAGKPNERTGSSRRLSGGPSARVAGSSERGPRHPLFPQGAEGGTRSFFNRDIAGWRVPSKDKYEK